MKMTCELKENCLLLKLYRKLRKMFLSHRRESNPQSSDLRWDQACSINIVFSCFNNREQLLLLHQCWTTLLKLNNIVCSTTLFIQQHCSFNNVRSTLFIQQHCSFNNIVCWTTLFIQQHCSFNNIVCRTTLFSHDNCVVPTIV